MKSYSDNIVDLSAVDSMVDTKIAELRKNQKQMLISIGALLFIQGLLDGFILYHIFP